MDDDYSEPMFGLRSIGGRSANDVAFPLLYMAILGNAKAEMDKPVPILIGSAGKIIGEGNVATVD